MDNFFWAMALKGLVFSGLVFALWLIIPAGRIKTALFRERPWNIWAWIVAGSLIWFAIGKAAYDIITGQ